MTVDTRCNFKVLDCCASTSSELATIADKAPGGTVIAAVRQTAGRGQRGNSWEAAPGENLTFSMLLRPSDMPAARQFEMSMCVSLAVAEVLRRHLPGIGISVKWPNDIYAGDRKICGILIENSVSAGMVDHAIAGIGINVNQRLFLSDAPNPVSMIHFLGNETPLRPLLEEVCGEIAGQLDAYCDSPDSAALLTRYRGSLWRGEGFHRFIDMKNGTGEFSGEITSVDPDGTLSIRDSDGILRRYIFKEVAYVL